MTSVLVRPECTENPVWVQEPLTTLWHTVQDTASHKWMQSQNNPKKPLREHPRPTFITTSYKTSQGNISHLLLAEVRTSSEAMQTDTDMAGDPVRDFHFVTTPAENEVSACYFRHAAPVLMGRYTSQRSAQYSCNQIPVLRCNTTPLAAG